MILKPKNIVQKDLVDFSIIRTSPGGPLMRPPSSATPPTLPASSAAKDPPENGATPSSLSTLKNGYPITFIDLRIWVIFDLPGWVIVQYFSCSKGGLPHRRWFWMFHWLSNSWSFSAKFLSHSHLILLHDPGGSTEIELFSVQRGPYSLHAIVIL